MNIEKIKINVIYKEYYKIQNKIYYWTNDEYRKNKNKCNLQRYHNINNLNVKTII
jgi:hypothetical protein